MKRIIFSLALALLVLVSCGTINNKKLQQVSLGMSRNEVTHILGKNYTILHGVSTQEGNMESIRYVSDYGVYYFFSFLDGRLVEYGEDRSPQPVQVVPSTPPVPYPTGGHVDRDVYGDLRISDNKGGFIIVFRDRFDNTVMEDGQGNRTVIKKDFRGEPEMEDSRGNKSSFTKDIFGDYSTQQGNEKISVRRDIFGDLTFSGAGGKTASLKKDIFDDRTYSDSQGNKVVIKKDKWLDVMKQYGDDQLLFISFIKRYLF